MDYLPHAAQVLYMRVLRRRMDYSTGIVGLAVRLSYQMIAEWLEVRPPPKSQKPIVRLTVSEIRAALAQLERVGLIERVVLHGEVLPLVFLLPLARTGLVRKNYERQDERQQNHGRATAKTMAGYYQFNGLNCSNKSNVYELKKPVDNYEKNSAKTGMNDSKFSDERQDERQTSGSQSMSNNNISIARGNGLVIADDWLPGDWIVEQVCLDFLLPLAFVRLKAMEFKIQWRDQLIIASDWDRYFYGACKNKIAERDGEFLSAQIKPASGGGHD